MKLTKNAMLKRAAEHIFSTGLEDGATHLSRANMRYGLAKIHYVLDRKGYIPNATFISTPDETITRNASRWEQGFSYGGKITWGDSKDKIIMLDTKPNACGMLVAGIDEVPDPKRLVEAVDGLNKSDYSYNGIKINWDFYKGNHFIDIFEVERIQTKHKLPKYAVVLHAGCPEFKGDVNGGFGLYWNMSRTLMEACETVRTPFHDTHILTGDVCKEYMRVYERADKFAKMRREIAFKEMFGGRKSQIISNITHQGMLNMNEITLGCQHIESRKALMPVSIRADLPSYLMHGIPNFSKEVIEDLGFDDRAQRLDVYGRLRKANIMPHGGGYYLYDSLSVKRVFEVKNRRFFEIEMVDGVGRKIISNIKELQFAYRDTKVILRTEELKLGEKAALLNPIYTLKV